ncbi:MAG TPA: ABC transporter substrate-binding protein [Pseudonocardiaceae bacterium]|jgi:peptide/nickel transport system substrate-binding protein|nr:ABC transporter substrate-binding protein [Pseudonocardiaceae bacterium]
MARTRLGLALGAAVLGVAALVTACGGGSSSGGTPQQGGVVNWAELPGESPTWIFPFIDPPDNSGANVAQFEYLMYRPLYWQASATSPDVDFNLSLADKPTYTGNKIVVNLKDYSWSNGEKLTPTDVLFFMNMLFAEKNNFSQYVPGEFPDNVTAVSQTGPSQVTFTLNGTYSADWFTGNQLFQITPMPEAWDKTTDSASAGSGGCASDQSKCAAVYNYLIAKNKNVSTYASDPLWQVVDGPWQLKSFTSEGAADFVPNQKYSGPNKPKLDGFNEVPFTSPEAMYNAEKDNKTIQVGEIPASNLPQRDPSNSDLTPPSNPLGAGNYNLVNDPVWGWSYGFLNYNNPTAGPALKQLYVRQALQETIDQVTDARVAWRGYAVPATGPVPNLPASEYLGSEQKLNNGQGPYQFNLNKAKSTLTGHGWTEQGGVMTCTNAGTGNNQCGAGVTAGTKLSLSLEYANGSTSAQEEIQQWKSDASQAGIQLNLAAQPFNTVISDLSTCPSKPTTCNWQIGYFGYETFDSVPTGDGFFLPNSVLNWGGVNDPKMTNLVNATLHDSANNTFQSYENYTADQLPASFNFADPYKVYAAAKNLSGVSVNVLQAINPENWYFTK